jgi:hypothetical protein
MFGTKELQAMAGLVKPDVIAKLELFFNTPATIKTYCYQGETYLSTAFHPSELPSYGIHSFYYSSDQTPYYARIQQPCWGPLGGLKPQQTNLYIWCPLVKNMLNAFDPTEPYYIYFKDVCKGMFEEGTSDAYMKDFIGKYGLVLTPTVLDVWQPMIVVGFLMSRRYGCALHKNNALDTVIYYLTQGVGSWGCHDAFVTWKAVHNFINGTFNEHVYKLPAFSKDPDYSCWDSPIKNLFTEHNILHDGKKFITGRATDITWDAWVERNPRNGTDWYGRNNGYSNVANSGETIKDINKFLGPTGKTLPYDAKRDKVSEYIRERLKAYDTNDSKKAA